MSGWKALKESVASIAQLWEGRSDTYWVGRVEPDALGDQAVPSVGQAFDIQASYFTLRLAEMRLRSDRIGLSEYVPVCLVVADYFYNGAYRSMPFVVSNDQLRSAVDKVLKDGKPLPIELFDTLIVGPVPVRAPEIALFVGLFRMKRSDRADILLDVMGELGKGAGLSALTAGLPLAKTVYDGVKRLFGLGDVEFLFGTRLGFQFDQDSGHAPTLSSGYLGYSSLPKTDAGTRPFTVRQRRLVRMTPDGSASQVTDCDYALLAVEHIARRPGFEDLPFHTRFVELQKNLIENPDRDWKQDWLPLMSAIRTSPDLTRPDTTVALASYRAQIDEEVKLSKGEMPAAETRRAGAASVDGWLATAAGPTSSSRDVDRRPAVGPTDEAMHTDLAAHNTRAVLSLQQIASRVRERFQGKVPLPDPDVFAQVMLSKDFPG
jgi:hypothetical protein